MIIPTDWLDEAGVRNFTPAPGQLCFRFDTPDAAPVPLADIEPPPRFGLVIRSTPTGFDHKRMVSRLLVGIKDNVALPPIYIDWPVIRDFSNAPAAGR